MKYQPDKKYKSNDDVMTPQYLTKKIINHFNPKGKILEPCKGTGNFLKFLNTADWCEIKEGRDFLKYKTKVDWIITNPPYSKMRDFLKHSMAIADNIVFLITINHIWTKARLRDLKHYNFGIKEIYIVDTPKKDWTQSGFQLGCVYLKKRHKGKIKFNG